MSTAENPKTGAGRRKPTLSTTPEVALLWLGAVHDLGAAKYGAMNWRDRPIPSRTYYDAIRRHLAAWVNGEDRDPESGLPHLAHVMAGCAILLDADHNGSLVDDRQKGAALGAVMEEIAQVKATWPVFEKAA